MVSDRYQNKQYRAPLLLSSLNTRNCHLKTTFCIYMSFFFTLFLKLFDDLKMWGKEKPKKPGSVCNCGSSKTLICNLFDVERSSVTPAYVEIMCCWEILSSDGQNKADVLPGLTVYLNLNYYFCLRFRVLSCVILKMFPFKNWEKHFAYKTKALI